MPFVPQGGHVAPEVLVRNLAHASVDPDAGTLTVEIKDTLGVTLPGFPVTYPTGRVGDGGWLRIALGHYSYDWVTDVGQVLGTYPVEWNGAELGFALPAAVDEIEVIPAGSLTIDLLTIAEFRAFVVTDLADEPLQLLLDASRLAIAAILGPVGVRTETHDGGRSSIISLDRQAAAIGVVTETVGDTVTTLDPDDYLMRNDRLSLERLTTGTNPPASWGWRHGRSWSPWQGRVTVTYTPADDLAQRKVVQRQLVELDLAANAAAAAGSVGATSERIGEFSQAFGASATDGQSYQQSRQALLDSLLPATWSFS